jgi:hypothetical protein
VCAKGVRFILVRAECLYIQSSAGTIDDQNRSMSVTSGFEGKPNANHIRARISNSRTQRLHK